MFWLIETQEQFDEFKHHIGREIFAETVNIHPESHPGIYPAISLYIRNIDQDQETGFLINFKHPEALCFDPEQVRELLKEVSKIYTTDKKAFNYFYFGPNTVDIGIGTDITVKPNQTIQYYNQKYYADIDLNLIVPIVKHYEYCEDLYHNYKATINKYNYNQYDQDISDVFWFIERNSLKVSDAFEEHFTLERPFLSKHGNWIFTHYNLDTLTGRPSNAFNTVNFAALKKEDGCRSVFIPRNDFLLEIDLTAYHPTLISKLVGYESPTGDIYEDFAKEFNMDRAEAKILVFRQLYGNIYNQYENFEFFKLTKDYITSLWKKFNNDGYIEKIISKHKFTASSLENMNPQKLFNYLIQSYETENNVQVLKEILTVLNGGKSEVVLYTYDAFVIDTAKEDKEKIAQIIDIFKDNKLKIKVTYGKDYNSLKPL